MINLSLDVWIRRQLKTVQEDGASMCRLKLLHPEASQTYATWIAPFEDVAVLIAEIEDLFTSLPDEWSVGAHQVVLISADADGLDLARYPKTLRGKNRNASTNLLATEGQGSLAAMMAQLGELHKNLANLTNSQLSISQRTHEQDRLQIQEQYEYIRSLQQRNVLTQEETANNNETSLKIDDELKGALVGFIKDQVPVGMELWKMGAAGKADEAKALLTQKLAELALAKKTG